MPLVGASDPLIIVTFFPEHLMLTQTDRDFVNFLFDRLAPITDNIDLHSDDSHCDHVEFEKTWQLEMELGL